MLTLLVLALVVTCATAPWMFNGLIRLGRSVAFFSGLRDLTFEQVIARLVLVYVFLGFVPALRTGGARVWAGIGLEPHRRWSVDVWRGWCAGVASVAVLLAWAWGSGVFIWNPEPWMRVVARVSGYLVGGLVVGVIEEVYFRGAWLTALKRVWGWWSSALLVSLLFAGVHFLRPQAPEGIVWGHWHTGFGLLPHSIFVTQDLAHYLPFGLTLFLMSLTLCAFRRRQMHIYFIIGLHAGWVVVLQGARFLFDRDPAVESLWFGASTNVGRSWAALALMALFLVFALRGGRSDVA